MACKSNQRFIVHHQTIPVQSSPLQTKVLFLAPPLPLSLPGSTFRNILTYFAQPPSFYLPDLLVRTKVYLTHISRLIPISTSPLLAFAVGFQLSLTQKLGWMTMFLARGMTSVVQLTGIDK